MTSPPETELHLSVLSRSLSHILTLGTCHQYVNLGDTNSP